MARRDRVRFEADRLEERRPLVRVVLQCRKQRRHRSKVRQVVGSRGAVHFGQSPDRGVLVPLVGVAEVGEALAKPGSLTV